MPILGEVLTYWLEHFFLLGIPIFLLKMGVPVPQNSLKDQLGWGKWKRYYKVFFCEITYTFVFYYQDSFLMELGVGHQICFYDKNHNGNKVFNVFLLFQVYFTFCSFSQLVYSHQVIYTIFMIKGQNTATSIDKIYVCMYILCLMIFILSRSQR